MKLLYTIVFLLLTSIVFGQKSTLFQNVNVRAKELKHKLNDSGDSIVFNCERTIYEVVIFNDDFERVIKVRKNDAKIPIADIPVGRYIIEALLSDKLIVITLLRNEPFDELEPEALITDSSDLFGKKSPKKAVVASVEKPIEESKIEVKEEVAVTAKKIPTPIDVSTGNESSIKKTDLASAGKKAEPIIKEPKAKKRTTFVKNKTPKKSSLSLFNPETKVAERAPKRKYSREIDTTKVRRIVSNYWVVYKINDGQGSQKIQQMGDQEDVDRMIRKIEIDMKTKSGRLNELIIWTVYDADKFARHKRLNRQDYMSIPSESFKMEPYYKKVNDPDNI